MSKNAATWLESNQFDDFFVPSLTGELIPVGELTRRYFTSKYGQHQNMQELRFVDGGYGYDRDEMIANFGDDVHPLGHMAITGAIAAQIIAVEQQHRNRHQISELDAGVTVFACSTHDVGECTHPDLGKTVGDIAFGRKTDAHRAVEAGVVRGIHTEIFDDVDPWVLHTVRNLLAHKTTSIQHDVYEAAHTIQTIQTALNIGVAEILKRDTQVLTMLGFLSERYPAVQEPYRLFLQDVSPDAEQRATIEDVHFPELPQMSSLQRSIIDNHLPKLQVYGEQFMHAANEYDRLSAFKPAEISWR